MFSYETKVDRDVINNEVLLSSSMVQTLTVKSMVTSLWVTACVESTTRLLFASFIAPFIRRMSAVVPDGFSVCKEGEASILQKGTEVFYNEAQVWNYVDEAHAPPK